MSRFTRILDRLRQQAPAWTVEHRHERSFAGFGDEIEYGLQADYHGRSDKGDISGRLEYFVRFAGRFPWRVTGMAVFHVTIAGSESHDEKFDFRSLPFAVAFGDLSALVVFIDVVAAKHGKVDAWTYRSQVLERRDERARSYAANHEKYFGRN